jgi:hypothetical protein
VAVQIADHKPAAVKEDQHRKRAGCGGLVDAHRNFAGGAGNPAIFHLMHRFGRAALCAKHLRGDLAQLHGRQGVDLGHPRGLHLVHHRLCGGIKRHGSPPMGGYARPATGKGAAISIERFPRESQAFGRDQANSARIATSPG